MEKSSFLRLVSTFTIQPTDGKSVIAQEKELFNGYLGSDFRNWGLDKKGEVAPKTNIEVFELVKDANFSQIFNAISNNIDKLCLTQSQIIQIVRNHRNLLNQDGWANFFLMKENHEYFVTYVCLYSGGDLGAGVRRFDDVCVWHSPFGLRVFSRKLQDA